MTQITKMVWSLELTILEYEVKWALGSVTMNKASIGDSIPAELFQILKDDAIKMLHLICQQIGKLSSDHRTGKGCFHSNPKKEQYETMIKLPHK